MPGTILSTSRALLMCFAQQLYRVKTVRSSLFYRQGVCKTESFKSSLSIIQLVVRDRVWT